MITLTKARPYKNLVKSRGWLLCRRTQPEITDNSNEQKHKPCDTLPSDNLATILPQVHPQWRQQTTITSQCWYLALTTQENQSTNRQKGIFLPPGHNFLLPSCCRSSTLDADLQYEILKQKNQQSISGSFKCSYLLAITVIECSILDWCVGLNLCPCQSLSIWCRCKTKTASSLQTLSQDTRPNSYLFIDTLWEYQSLRQNPWYYKAITRMMQVDAATSCHQGNVFNRSDINVQPPLAFTRKLDINMQQNSLI